MHHRIFFLVYMLLTFNVLLPMHNTDQRDSEKTNTKVHTAMHTCCKMQVRSSEEWGYPEKNSISELGYLGLLATSSYMVAKYTNYQAFPHEKSTDKTFISKIFDNSLRFALPAYVVWYGTLDNILSSVVHASNIKKINKCVFHNESNHTKRKLQESWLVKKFRYLALCEIGAVTYSILSKSNNHECFSFILLLGLATYEYMAHRPCGYLE